jgi:hypothetical protein
MFRLIDHGSGMDKFFNTVYEQNPQNPSGAAEAHIHRQIHGMSNPLFPGAGS